MYTPENGLATFWKRVVFDDLAESAEKSWLASGRFQLQSFGKSAHASQPPTPANGGSVVSGVMPMASSSALRLSGVVACPLCRYASIGVTMPE